MADRPWPRTRRRSFSAALPGVADLAVAAVLRDLLPRADGDPGRVLARDADRVRPDQLRLQHAASSTRCYDPLYLEIFVRTLLMAAVGLAAHDRRRLPARLLDGALPLDLQDAGAAADRRAVLDVVPDPHLRAQDHPRPAAATWRTDLGIDILYTKYAVGIGLVYNYLPLFILPVFASLERMDWTLVEAATDLGAKPFTRVPADHAAAHAARRGDRGAAGVHPDDRRVHHPEHPRRREVRVRRQRHRRPVQRRPRTSRSARRCRSR